MTGHADSFVADLGRRDASIHTKALVRKRVPSLQTDVMFYFCQHLLLLASGTASYHCYLRSSCRILRELEQNSQQDRRALRQGVNSGTRSTHCLAGLAYNLTHLASHRKERAPIRRLCAIEFQLLLRSAQFRYLTSTSSGDLPTSHRIAHPIYRLRCDRPIVGFIICSQLR